MDEVHNFLLHDKGKDLQGTCFQLLKAVHLKLMHVYSIYYYARQYNHLANRGYLPILIYRFRKNFDKLT
jgi:hypothetical protein